MQTTHILITNHHLSVRFSLTVGSPSSFTSMPARPLVCTSSDTGSTSNRTSNSDRPQREAIAIAAVIAIVIAAGLRIIFGARQRWS